MASETGSELFEIFDDSEIVFIVDNYGIGFHPVGSAGCLVKEVALKTFLFRLQNRNDQRRVRPVGYGLERSVDGVLIHEDFDIIINETLLYMILEDKLVEERSLLDPHLIHRLEFLGRKCTDSRTGG